MQRCFRWLQVWAVLPLASLACNVYDASLVGADASFPTSGASTTGSDTVSGAGGAGDGVVGTGTGSGGNGTGVGGSANTSGGGSTGSGDVTTVAGTSGAGTGAGGAGGGNGGAAGTRADAGGMSTGAGGAPTGAGGTRGSGGGGAAGTGGRGSGGSGGNASGASGGGGGGSSGPGAGGAGAGGPGGAAPVEAGVPEASVPDVQVVDAASPGAVFAVGSFVKTSTVGAQVIRHSLGQTPKAILIWTVGATDATPGTDSIYAMGSADGPRSGMSASMSSRGGVTPTSASRRLAKKALSIVQWDRTTVAEADVAAWDGTSLTIDWTTNNDAAYIVHYVVIGGIGISAKVVPWQAPTTIGPKSTAGVGFQPDLVFHFHVGWFFTSLPPATDSNSGFGFSMMDRAGGQCASHVRASDAKNPSLAGRSMKTDSSLYITNEIGPVVTKRATFVSMDNDGFTMNFTTANTSASQIFSLALSGLRARVGSFVKTPGVAPARQPVTAIGFKPGVVLMSSVQDVAEAGISVDHVRFGIGAADGSRAVSSALNDTNGVSPSVAGVLDFIDGVFVKMNNATRTVDAKAELASLDSDGFTLNWTANDAVASQICYVALGAP